MSSVAEAIPVTPVKPNPSLWLTQINAIFWLEIQKNFFSRRSVLIYLLALLPLLPLSLIAILQPDSNEFRDFRQLSLTYAFLYNGLILQTVVFFGCAWIFMNLFRGELVDRSLHYYFLSSVRREVLVVGKYISGLATSIVLFTATTVISLLLLYLPLFYSESVRFFTAGQGLKHLGTYALITILACIGYGAFFTVVGLFVRNPIIPAIVLYGWEWINFLLPPLLKKISVVHYLKSLMPVPMSEGPFAVVAEPTPAWLAIPGLILVTIIVLIISGYRIRKMEIRYGGD